MNGKIIIFSGYAGAGKNTIINALLKEYPHLTFIPSVTTRNMREGEKEGKPYFFRSLDEFMKLKAGGAFIETEPVHGNWYGTLKQKYEEALGKGKVIVKDIDVNGANKFRQEFSKSVYSIFIKPSNDEDVLERMRTRGDTEEEIEKRKERIQFESSFIDECDVVVINDDLEAAIEQCKSILSRIHVI